MSINNGYPTPDTYAHEQPVCGRCASCHPGRAFGGDWWCKKPGCGCHRRTA